MGDLRFWKPATAVQRKGCKRLIGKTFTWVASNGETFEAVIGGADPYIGLSVVKASNPKSVLRCLHGPFDPNFRERYLEDYKDYRFIYNLKFPLFVDFLKEAVKTGRAYEKVLNNIYISKGGTRGGGGNGACPFGI